MQHRREIIQVLLSIFIGALMHLPLNASAEEKCGPYDGVDLTAASGHLICNGKLWHWGAYTTAIPIVDVY